MDTLLPSVNPSRVAKFRLFMGRTTPGYVFVPLGSLYWSSFSCQKFNYDDIREVLKRRYLLQPIALEIFNSDGINVLLAFPPKMRNSVLHK